MKKTYPLSLRTLYLLYIILASYCYSSSTTSAVVGDFYINKLTILQTQDTSLASICDLIKEGNKYHDQAAYREAISYYEEALKRYEQSFKKDKLLCSKIYNNMGMSYLGLEFYKETYFYYNKALTLRNKLLLVTIEDEKRKVVSEAIGKSLHNLGIFYLTIQKLKEASEAFNASLKTEWQHHIEAIETEYYLAKSYQREGFYQLSKAVYKAILAKQTTNSYLTGAKVKKIEKYLKKINIITQKTNSHKPFSSINRLQLRQEHSSLSDTAPPQKPCFSYQQYEHYAKEKTDYSRDMQPHVGKKRFQRPICEEKFTEKNKMAVDMQTHNSEKPFQCPICQKKFTEKNKMAAHMHTHNSEKPFQCPICQKKFTEKNKMESHITNKHEKPILIPSSIPTIIATFPQINSYSAPIPPQVPFSLLYSIATNKNTQQHSSTYDRWKKVSCTCCNKRFRCDAELKRHMRSHTGEKPFHCSICQKSFPFKQSLKLHMHLHAGEKKFRCPICRKGFRKKDNMKFHLKTHKL